MSKLASILLIVLTFSLGGVQTIIRIGQEMAQQRAIKFQRYRGEMRSTLDAMTFTAKEFSQMSIEEVGHGVIEFELNGFKYDAFEVIESDGFVKLLVKKDNLDTALSRVSKYSKRLLRDGASIVKAQLFNFYFAHGFSLPKWTNDCIQLTRNLQISNTLAPLIGVSPPPPW
ncbi:MAG: hypothetical protein R2813_14005 [Flavobacteriales bacterium]